MTIRTRVEKLEQFAGAASILVPIQARSEAEAEAKEAEMRADGRIRPSDRVMHVIRTFVTPEPRH